MEPVNDRMEETEREKRRRRRCVYGYVWLDTVFQEVCVILQRVNRARKKNWSISEWKLSES